MAGRSKNTENGQSKRRPSAYSEDEYIIDDRADHDSGRDGEEYREPPRKKHTVLIIVLILIAMIAAAALIAYILGERYFRTHFAPGTAVNGIDVSRMTEDEVKSLLGETIQDYKLTIHERTGDGGSAEETIQGGEVGLELEFDDSLDKALQAQSQGGWVWMLTGSTREISIGTSVTYNADAWKLKMDSLQCFQDDFITEPEDAYLDSAYQIVAEVQGNEPYRDVVEQALLDAVLSLKTEINLEDVEGAYHTPAITSDDEELNAKHDSVAKYADITITYRFGDSTETLDGATIVGWLNIDDDGSVTLDSSKVEDYVASLRKKYDTIFRTRTFLTTYGEEVTLSDGDYGWWMNYVQEAKDLEEMIENGESGERTPDYYQTAAQYGEEDWGDTYVEVNLTAQHLFFYQEGELVLESDFVSGNSSKGNATPEGIYGITYKERNATLEGENYATPVSYWMPFNGNVGLHDATWRSRFGKNFYRSSGSHGCVNLPYYVAKQLYSMVSKGTPVICYNLEGTESDSVTEQGDEEIAQAAIDAIDNIGEVVKTEDCKELIERARQVYDDLSRSEKSYVTNYDTLKEAEAAYKALGG